MNVRLFSFFIACFIFLPLASAAPTVSYFFNTTTQEDLSITFNDIVVSSSVVFQILTDVSATCKYSNTEGTPYGSMEGTFDFDFDTLHKENLLGLEDGVYTYYVRCQNQSGSISNQLETIFSIITPVTAQISLSEDSPIGGGVLDITLITSKVVQGTPSLSYSFDGISYNPIPLSGSGTQWDGYLIVPSSLGEAVGSFSFSASDLGGNVGTEITNGGVFLIDTEEPDTIIAIDATGYKGRVELDWHLDTDDDIDYYNIYRSLSPNVDFSNFYEETDETTYSDTIVEAGTTYYYRVVAVDKAGNEGDLSVEVFATALFDDVNPTPTGLSLDLHGFVDNSLSSIDLVLDDVDAVESSFSLKSEQEQSIISDLQLEKDISSVRTELQSLKNDVEKYKSQSLTETELNNKLNSAEIRLNTIKKKVPEDIAIISQETYTPEISQSDIEQTLLELTLDVASDNDAKRIKQSVDAMESFGFSVERSIYTLEIVFLDGSRTESSLIKEVISSSIGDNANYSIVEVIPKQVASSVSEMEIKTSGHSVLKEDPIISFGSDTQTIIYVVSEHIDLSLIDEIRTVLLREEVKTVSTSGFDLTGYAIAIGSGSAGYAGVIISILIVLALTGYFVVIRKKGNTVTALKPLLASLDKAHAFLAEGELEKARSLYSSLSLSYKKLDKGSKRHIYPRLEAFQQAYRESGGAPLR